MVEKTDAGFDIVGAGAVEIDGDGDFGFAGLPRHFCRAAALRAVPGDFLNAHFWLLRRRFLRRRGAFIAGTGAFCHHCKPCQALTGRRK